MLLREVERYYKLQQNYIRQINDQKHTLDELHAFHDALVRQVNDARNLKLQLEQMLSDQQEQNHKLRQGLDTPPRQAQQPTVESTG